MGRTRQLDVVANRLWLRLLDLCVMAQRPGAVVDWQPLAATVKGQLLATSWPRVSAPVSP